MEPEVFKLYKPVRNHLRRVSIENAFYVIWAYVRCFQFSTPIPKDIQVDQSILSAKDIPSRGLYEWELSLLAREVLANGESELILSTESFNKWSYFSNVINKIKNFENNVWPVIGSKELLRHELRRIAHRQFPWHFKITSADFVRYYKIYNNPRIRDKVKEIIGINTQDWYVIGTAILGAFLSHTKMNIDSNIELTNVTKKEFDIFLDFISNTIDGFREIIKKDVKYDDQYVYSFNPLEYFPLVEIGSYYYCPIINFLAWRITSGLYFDLIKNDKNTSFGNAFGLSFQDYLYEISEKVLDSKKILHYREDKYKVDKLQKDSVDLIIKQGDSFFFVEAKAKRMQVKSKTQLSDESALKEDIDVLAEDIVQVYQTLDDFKKGHYSHLEYKEGDNIYSMVVTLEDWYLLGEDLLDVQEKVKEKMRVKGLSEDMIEKHPYILCSVKTFEILIQVLNTRMISEIMSDWLVPEKVGHDFGNFLITEYGKGVKYIDNFFPEDFEKIYKDQLGKRQQ